MAGLSEEISRWIRRKVKRAGARGVVVGLSGGVDSAVTAILSKKAMGDKVFGLIMPCYTEPKDQLHAEMIAQRFGIRTRNVVLDGLYDKLMETLPLGNKLAVANLKPRLRMLTLYFFANLHNYLVVGTGNKSEISIGYFTKYGDGGVDLLPLGGLLKTQVRELAKELEVPEEIIQKVPTAGLFEGQTDEGEIGLSYEDLDETLSAIERSDIKSLPPERLNKVEELMKASRHKRTLPSIFKPPIIPTKAL